MYLFLYAFFFWQSTFLYFGYILEHFILILIQYSKFLNLSKAGLVV